MLGGRTGAVRDAVVLNAAGAMVAHAGLASDAQWVPAWEDALTRVSTAIDSGAAAALLDKWIAVSQRLGAQ
ncbi:anthranilate phosphoribosyltransferase [Mycobacteroides abscessus subsp. massiliense]|nr:anthranilate phosphoribosyltransferase [Mycobacteroides abscessus subsp. massiliense]